jgi:hypothetical protein
MLLQFPSQLGEDPMADLKSSKLIYLKGFLFLICGAVSGILILLENPTLRVAVLLVVCIWCCSRFYYFAFYVIEHYVDPQYRFAGLVDFASYVLRRNNRA